MGVQLTKALNVTLRKTQGDGSFVQGKTQGDGSFVQ
jgi:hypothetical protein